MPYTSMLASLLSVGIDYGSAVRMGFGFAANILRAKNELSDTGGNDGVRDATQADIRKFMCG